MQTSANHPLDNGDPADLPRCPMERLADRFEDAPKPKWLKVWTYRNATSEMYFELRGHLFDPDQIEDLINYLARVKG